MKRLLLILIPLALIGGGVFATWKLGVGPFKRAKRAGASTAAAKVAGTRAAQKSAARAEPPPTLSEVRTPARAARKVKPEAAAPDPQTEARLAKLASVYEQMPPEEAGKIVAKLPDGLVEQLLRRMDERQAGKLLLTLDVNRAARLTQALAH